MNNHQLKHLDKLEAEAAQLAASFYSRTLRAEPGSDAAKRFKRLAEKANTGGLSPNRRNFRRHEDIYNLLIGSVIFCISNNGR